MVNLFLYFWERKKIITSSILDNQRNLNNKNNSIYG